MVLIVFRELYNTDGINPSETFNHTVNCSFLMLTNSSKTMINKNALAFSPIMRLQFVSLATVAKRDRCAGICG